MDTSLAPVGRSDRARAALDRIRHPRLVGELARATDGFRARGLARRYANDRAGRRREAVELSILWHRGYRPPPALVHNAMWWTGGPTIVIPFAREVRREPMSDRQRELLARLGVDRG